MEEAESHQNVTAGWWPLSDAGPAFYSYAYPEPEGFRAAAVRPAAASFDDRLGEFLLPYDAVRTAADPDAAVLRIPALDLRGGRRPRRVGSSRPRAG